jgi:hypothetical protein
MRVPVAAAMTTGRGDAAASFDAALQQVVDARREPQDTARAADAAPEPAPVVDQAAEDPPQEPVAGEVAASGTEGDATPTGAPFTAADEVADVTESTRRGEPGRQAIAGKGTDSPRPSSRRPDEPLLIAAIQHQAGQGASAVGGGDRGALAVSAAGEAAKATAPAAARGGDLAANRPQAPLPTPAAAGSYRTTTAAQVRLLDHARDSVFKQILLHLRDDGGEMRLRLQPPELGELDLHLVVEKGSSLRLSIAAERADLAAMLERHLDALKQTLQEQGLQVAHAEVRTQGDGAHRQHGARRDERGADANERRELDPIPARRSGGYVTAEGLDFWV